MIAPASTNNPATKVAIAPMNVAKPLGSSISFTFRGQAASREIVALLTL
jgi:hypothetical protein